MTECPACLGDPKALIHSPGVCEGEAAPEKNEVTLGVGSEGDRVLIEIARKGEDPLLLRLYYTPEHAAKLAFTLASAANEIEQPQRAQPEPSQLILPHPAQPRCPCGGGVALRHLGGVCRPCFKGR